MEKKKVTQNDMILEYLQEGNKLTPIEALGLFGCFRLGARISDLRERGYAIRTKMILTKTGKRIAEYSL